MFIECLLQLADIDFRIEPIDYEPLDLDDLPLVSLLDLELTSLLAALLYVGCHRPPQLLQVTQHLRPQCRVLLVPVGQLLIELHRQLLDLVPVRLRVLLQLVQLESLVGVVLLRLRTQILLQSL